MHIHSKMCKTTGFFFFDIWVKYIYVWFIIKLGYLTVGGEEKKIISPGYRPKKQNLYQTSVIGQILLLFFFLITKNQLQPFKTLAGQLLLVGSIHVAIIGFCFQFQFHITKTIMDPWHLPISSPLWAQVVHFYPRMAPDGPAGWDLTCNCKTRDLMNMLGLHLYVCVCVYLCVYTCVSAEDYGENRMVRTRSLSKISSSVARQQYVDTSDEEEYQRYLPVHQQPPHRRRNSRASSQENLGQPPPVRACPG